MFSAGSSRSLRERGGGRPRLHPCPLGGGGLPAASSRLRGAWCERGASVSRVCVCVRARQGINSNCAQAAKFNSPTLLSLLQTMSSVLPYMGAALLGVRLHVYKCRQQTLLAL